MGKKADSSKVKPNAPLLVSWLDIHNDEGGWKPKEEVAYSECRVETVGWFLGAANGHLMLCADLSQDGDTNTRMLIPFGCIVDWQVIALG